MQAVLLLINTIIHFFSDNLYIYILQIKINFK